MEVPITFEKFVDATQCNIDPIRRGSEDLPHLRETSFKVPNMIDIYKNFCPSADLSLALV